ncbi:MAG: hypothetical protein Q9192_003787, partial [Flavoplaca navasiana]
MLEQFYVIYVRNLTRWDDLDVAGDHKDELVALQATLSLYEKNLNWQTGTETLEGNRFNTVTVTHGGETFWMSGLNRKSFHDYLSVQTFTGSARMRSRSPSGGGNFTENDIVRRIEESLYEDHAGIQGLSDLLENLTISMSNALRTTTDIPDNFPGKSISFEVYIQIEWAWMSVDERPHCYSHTLLDIPADHDPSKSAAKHSCLEIIVAGSLIGSKSGDTKSTGWDHTAEGDGRDGEEEE